ncbi:MAG: DEAD/DEAH box helicase [Deltaproteobacteria bacterium]|nr:DEAD/DEAH box helicase [Deltaproteobacteria bacterium]
MAISFHPLVQRWFSERFSRPTEPQEKGWEHIAEGEATLIAAPTGSGKTLAAFLWSINRLIERALSGLCEDKTSIIYVSPLKALGNDIERNLKAPLEQIYRLADSQGTNLPEIRVAVRSGDTPARERQSMLRRPPHILITTPESLYILLTAQRSRQLLRTADTVIIDEIHAVAGDKRGSHLALSLERLDALAGKPLQRIGLSATQKPIDEIARFLVGTEQIRSDKTAECAIVDSGHQRDLNLSVELPDQELGPIATHEMWSDVYDRIVAHSKANRTTLVFVNTRRLVERVAHQLSARLGDGKVGAHHGSLSRKARLEVEEKLKSGTMPVVVATASLELGIDIGHVELVCHIGAPRSLATMLQRIGRSGHWLGATPKGIFYPLTRDELVQCAAAIRAARSGKLDRVLIPEKPLDVLAQQIVATVSSMTASVKQGDSLFLKGIIESGIGEEELFALIHRAYPYRKLEPREFEQLLDVLSEGIASRKGRRSAHLHRDRVNRRLRGRRGARMIAITNGGAIPDTADYDVIEAPAETFVGKVNEDFAIESLAGDIFLLGNRSWRIRRVAAGKVWVEDAHGAPPTVPFWLGEASARTRELSDAVSDLRREVAGRLDDATAAMAWLERETAVARSAAEQIVAYLGETCKALGIVPTTDRVVAERFFDEAGGMQLVLHTPYGGRINRAWGLALRKRFCVGFDRELQAAATDDGLVISLVEQHSFPLKDVFLMVRSASVENDLVQAALASPMFTNRWRWNTTRALALLRFSGGRKVPMALQRMRAEDLLAAVFPEQVMCLDNRMGAIEAPDHPLLHETLHDCLHEAMDLDGLKEILEKIERGAIKTMAVDTTAPSPMSHEILNANPYAFLDDAPLEERRARAVSLRRASPDLAQGLGALNPDAIAEVRNQAWPAVRDADELHDLLLTVCLLPLEQALEWRGFAEELIGMKRAAFCFWSCEGSGNRRGYIAAERLDPVCAALPDLRIEPAIQSPFPAKVFASREEALRTIVRGWMDLVGPITATELAARVGLPVRQVETALFALETSGIVLRGNFTPAHNAQEEPEWCERGLLARIHRLTLGQLRREIEPVTGAEFIRFLFSWQHVAPESRLQGREGVLEVITQLQGLELPAPAWEKHVLPARIVDYDPADLESLCLGGMVAWGRLNLDAEALPLQNEEQTLSAVRARASHAAQKVLEVGREKRRARRLFSRNAPIAFLPRENLHRFMEPVSGSWDEVKGLTGAAMDVARYLERHGASFVTDIAQGAGLLKTKAEEALWELVARGLVTGDGIAGLRILLAPEVKRQGRIRRFRMIPGGRARDRLMPVGRWYLYRASLASPENIDRGAPEEFLARQLLRRYGVVFRELLARETRAPSWRTLLPIYRQLEARGEIRGGRFVNGFAGEQYALPQAVEMLRSLRRSQTEGEVMIVASSDPLNFVGILTPGARVSPYSNQAIGYKDGVPAEVGALGAVRARLHQAEAGVAD